MNFNTLTLYLVAGALSVCLSAVMWAVAYQHPGARLIKSWASAILVMATGFVVSGFGPQLPVWMTVIGTNMVLLAAGPVIYSGMRAFGEQQPARWDHWGWAIVALTALPFWYWGLIEPDGHYRAAVFSFAAALINVRTAHILMPAPRRTTLKTLRNISRAMLAALFYIHTLWMLGRGLYLLFTEPVAASVRGANPTSWITVFWYIVLVTVATLLIFWLDFGSQTPTRAAPAASLSGFAKYSRHKLQLLWVTVLILVLSVVSEGFLYYAKSFEWEQQRLVRNAEVSNDAFVQHALQVLGQVDTILHAVRTFYAHTDSVAQTEAFINALPFDKSTIDNVYLISAQGKILISNDPAGVGVSIADREYFQFQQTASGDQIFLGPVERGRVTGKYHFGATRRINDPGGRLVGILLCTVSPAAFSRYFENQTGEPQSTAALLGTLDHKLRARTPAPAADQWQSPVDSPLWAALEKSPFGHYRNVSMVDGVERGYVYRKVPSFPLVMVTGFSAADVRAGVHENLLWLEVGAVAIVVAVLVLALLLRIEIRQRIEQNRFFSMLSHELKTPLSTIGMALGNHSVPDTVKQRIGRSVSAMNAVIDRCLQSDRLASGRVEVVVDSCNIAALAEDVRTACSAPERVNIRAGELPSVRTDRQLLSVILGNLIDNALKYGESGSTVGVNITLVQKKGRDRILVEVSNRAGSAGVPDLHQVFKKYYRAPGAHGKTGSGLGLHIAQGFAQKIGGELRFQPSPDQVQFALWIPV